MLYIEVDLVRVPGCIYTSHVPMMKSVTVIGNYLAIIISIRYKFAIHVAPYHKQLYTHAFLHTTLIN